MASTIRDSSERGATIVLVALSLTALMSVVALAIDVGMLLNSKSEAQRAADAGALAGAGMLLSLWGQPDDVRGPEALTEAVQFGEMNNVFDQMAAIQPGDVDVDLVNNRVTVRVHRETSRGNAVLTWFANVFGVSEVDISADATAEVGLASIATCVKPWTIPDAWNDVDNDGEYIAANGDIYQQGTEDGGTSWGGDFRNPSQPGYGQMNDGLGNDNMYDWGRQIVLKPGHPNASPTSGWFYPWDIERDGEPDTGGNRYRENIVNCYSSEVALSEEYMIEDHMVENGNMIGPTKQGVDSLISLDPELYWDDVCNCVGGTSAYGSWTASPRIVTVPFFDPTLPLEPGKKPIKFNNFGLLFLEEIQGNTVKGRFLGYAPGLGSGENNPGVNLLQVRLVE